LYSIGGQKPKGPQAALITVSVLLGLSTVSLIAIAVVLAIVLFALIAAGVLLAVKPQVLGFRKINKQQVTAQ
jgi:hypothetical protein